MSPEQNLTPQTLSPQLSEKLALGKALRKATPRSSHGQWQPAADRPDPIELLERSNQGRLTNLLPIRYSRMAKSPFAFLRGSALLMAQDLATTPTTGLAVQGVGDCHLLNFGAFATPERNLIFDLNDFDETLPAPWEWDVKRLGASVLVAGQEMGFRERKCRSAVVATVRSYRRRLAEFAEMTALQVWYSRLTVEKIMELSQNKKPLLKNKPVNHHAASALLPKITQMVDGQPQIIDDSPLVYHPEAHDQTLEEMQAALPQYRSSLRDDVRVLFDRYQLVDIAFKVVGVGSVGTRCAIALLMAGDQDPLFLQIKEARRSVFEPYTRKSIYESQGQRVVTGQRLLQAASDIFLGWMQSEAGHHFYVRQLQDMKSSVDLDDLTPAGFQEYGEFCGWALARAHARSGDAAQIAGYLGQSETFETAIADFATAYAQQNNQDYQALVQAIKSGKVVARETDAIIP
ncbi:MAG: DUF2252 domain-containing protein [Coleofasciculaceae cyanobacterium SM2_1_6]|nr:DUF2252 domain-containing protein [Coleofasciculaceae cyanobacterium SM2_1_6]